MDKYLLVGAGGAVGAMCRYMLSTIPFKGNFPIITMATNIIGAVLIGCVIGISMQFESVSSGMILFLKTGVCGGFTTFSTFSAETLTLIENNQIVSGSLYAALSVALCIVGVTIGKTLISISVTG